MGQLPNPRAAAIAQLIAMTAPHDRGRLASTQIPIAPGGYSPGTIHGGPPPGTPPRPPLNRFAKQDRQLLKVLQKRYASEGEVTVVEGPDGYQFDIPGGERIDTPSTFQQKHGGVQGYRGDDHPVKGLPYTGPTVL